MNYHLEVLHFLTSRCSAGQRRIESETNGRPGVLDKKNRHRQNTQRASLLLAPCAVRRADLYIAHAPGASTTSAGLPSGIH